MINFFAFVFILVLAIDVVLHLQGKQTFSRLVHSIAPQWVDYIVYAGIIIAIRLIFGTEIMLYIAVGCLVDHLFGERKDGLD